MSLVLHIDWLASPPTCRITCLSACNLLAGVCKKRHCVNKWLKCYCNWDITFNSVTSNVYTDGVSLRKSKPWIHWMKLTNIIKTKWWFIDLSFQIIPWSYVLLEDLTTAVSLFIVFTIAHNLSISWTRQNQLTLSYSTSPRTILISSSHLRLIIFRLKFYRYF